MKKLILFAIVALFLPGSTSSFAQQDKPSQPTLYWYTVDLIGGTAQFCGTSPLDEAALAKAMEGTAFIRLDNLVYFDQNRKAQNFTDWTPLDEPHIYINPKEIRDFQLMKGDPRQDNDKQK